MIQCYVDLNSRFIGTRVLAFLGTGNPLGFLAPDVPKPGFLKAGTRNPQSILSSRVPVNGNPNLTPPGNLIELGIDIRAFYTSVTPSAEETLFA